MGFTTLPALPHIEELMQQETPSDTCRHLLRPVTRRGLQSFTLQPAVTSRIRRTEEGVEVRDDGRSLIGKPLFLIDFVGCVMHMWSLTMSQSST